MGGGVDAVRLHAAGDVEYALQDEGHVRDAVAFGERGVDGVEARDVGGAVVGGEGDAGEGDGDVGGLELLDDGGEVGLGLFEGKAAKAVVAAELEDDEGGVVGEEAREAVDGVLGGVAGDAVVGDAVVVAGGVEEMLEVVGVGEAGVDAEAGGDGVAETDEERASVGWSGRGLGCGGSFGV